MTTLTDADLERLAELAEKASKAPWRVYVAESGSIGACVVCDDVPEYVQAAISNVIQGIAWKDSSHPAVVCDDIDNGVGVSDDKTLDNFAFIAAARDAVPALVAEVRRLRATLHGRDLQGTFEARAVQAEGGDGD